MFAARVTGDNEPLDLNGGIRVNQGPRTFLPRRHEVAAAFDGSHYLVSFTRPFGEESLDPGAGSVFLARVGPDGTVADAENEGLLVSEMTTGGATAVVATSNHVLVAWRDSRHSAPRGGGPSLDSVYAQRLQPSP